MGLTILPSDPRIGWVGRRADSDPAQVTLGYSGVLIELEVRASRVVAHFGALSDDCSFDVVVVGQGRPGAPRRKLRLSRGRHEVEIAHGLDATGPVRLALQRRNEAWQGLVEVCGFEIEGELCAAPVRPVRRLLCVGDSITAGEAVECEAPDWDSSPRSSNGGRAWGWLLGRRIGADVHLVAYGGRGLVRDWRGLTTLNAPGFFERALPDDPNALWDHSRWIPDVVVVALGANDFNTGIVDERAYVDAYVAFVQRIRETAPGASIVLSGCPLFGRSGDDLAKREALMAYLRHTAERSGGRILVADVEHQSGSAHNAHPTAAQHVGIADDLEPVVRRVVGQPGEASDRPGTGES